MENFILAALLATIIIAVLREVTCWYFKFNRIVELLVDIKEILNGK